MIPLGLKETKEIFFHEQFSDFILEHYSENPSSYEDAIVDLSDTRQVIVDHDLTFTDRFIKYELFF